MPVCYNDPACNMVQAILVKDKNVELNVWRKRCFVWVIFLPVYCRTLQLCPLASQSMLIAVTLNHQASLSCKHSTSATSILSPAKGKVEQFT